MRKVFEAWYVTYFWYVEHTHTFLEKETAEYFLENLIGHGHESYMQMFESIMDNGKIRPVEEDDPEWELVVNKSPMCEYSSELIEEEEE